MKYICRGNKESFPGRRPNECIKKAPPLIRILMNGMQRAREARQKCKIEGKATERQESISKDFLL